MTSKYFEQKTYEKEYKKQKNRKKENEFEKLNERNRARNKFVEQKINFEYIWNENNDDVNVGNILLFFTYPVLF